MFHVNNYSEATPIIFHSVTCFKLQFHSSVVFEVPSATEARKMPTKECLKLLQKVIISAYELHDK